jgi:putative ABC transport system permease protein
MRTLLRDLHFALRQLPKAPGFALTAVLTMAIGIGGVRTVFSVVEAVLLRPLLPVQVDLVGSFHAHIRR